MITIFALAAVITFSLYLWVTLLQTQTLVEELDDVLVELSESHNSLVLKITEALSND